jgi:hypothetical protein
LKVKLIELLTLPPLVAQLIQVLGGAGQETPVGGFCFANARRLSAELVLA